jgi:hypothetical protein
LRHPLRGRSNAIMIVSIVRKEPPEIATRAHADESMMVTRDLAAIDNEGGENSHSLPAPGALA